MSSESMLSAPAIARRHAAALAAEVKGPVLLQGDPGYAAECATYNTAVPYLPMIAVGAACTADVQAAVRFAQAHDRPVAVLNTGHTSLPPVPDAVLINTRRMTNVHIDAKRARALVGAGARWEHVVEAGAPYGLAPLNGSSAGVGVVGYTLGGGLSPTMGRRFGWASDHVTALTIVTADGAARQSTAATEADLFWAVRGAKDNMGIVTELEFGLFPVSRLYGGVLTFAGEHVETVLDAYARLTAVAPDELTTSIAFVRLPDMPTFPAPLRGTFTVHVRVSWIGAAADADALLRPLRATAPALADSLGEMPYTAFADIHSDPVQPLPFAERTTTLPTLDPSLTHRLATDVGPQSEGAPTIVGLRHLGGALARPSDNAGAAGLRDAEFVLWVIAVGEGSATKAAMRWTDNFFDGLEPWTLPGKHLNFIARDDTDENAVRAAYPEETYRRLQAIKTRYDPRNVFRLGHNIPPLG